MFSPLFVLLLLFAATITALGYAPASTKCPPSSLLRDANGLSGEEEEYRVARKAVADAALISWLAKTNSGFGTSDLPTIAMSSSGGGYRALLNGAGVIQAFDGRESNTSTSGLYQALTYHSGLSGGGWLLSSFFGNNYPTISWLSDNIWKPAFKDSPLDPSGLLAGLSLARITSDVLSKELGGFPATIVDIYGRLISYQLFPSGTSGGVETTFSSISSLSSFTSHSIPYPILTSLGVKTWKGECSPLSNATTYEFTPYEFGSWDSDVSSFTQTQYLGTSMKGGKPTSASCTTHYDQTGYILGTSSNIFPPDLCISTANLSSTDPLLESLMQILENVHEITTADYYGLFNNPFFGYKSTTQTVSPANDIAAQETLSLMDGGLAEDEPQINPIFPFLLPERNVSVIIVHDNSAESTNNNWPSGRQILSTYTESFSHNYTRMPFIPSVDIFASQNLTQKPVFFGCNDPSKTTIVYLANKEYTFASNTSTYKLQYSYGETDSMILNSGELATQAGDENWGTCLACAVMMKSTSALPDACEACLEEYCYTE